LRLRRRLLAALTICGALVLASGTAGLAAPAPAPRAGAAPASSFVIATYNIRHALSDAVATADVQRLAATGVDVIALQEMGSRMRRNAVRAQLVDCATCEFRAYMPEGSGPAEVPFLFRAAAFELVGKGTEQVSEATYVGPDGAGGSTMGPKYLTYVQLRHVATGRDIYVINSHAVPSIQGPSGGPNYGNPERLALFRQHMDGLVAMVSRFEATGAAVFATGDFNVNYRRDAVVQDKTFPYYRMKQIGMYASYKYAGSPALGSQQGTTRLIDQVASSGTAGVTVQDQSILTGYSSDHRPVRVRYAVAPMPVPPAAPATVTAQPLERAASVTWPPAGAGAAPVTAYTVTAVQNGARVTVPGTATSAVVPGLTSGTSYTFQVRAVNSVGTGPSSPESNAVVPFAVPPETTITTGPAPGAFVLSSEATLGYTSNSAGAGFSCSLDGAALPCAAPSVRLTALSQGTHLFGTAASDVDGDVDPTPATRAWTVPLDSTTLKRTASWSLKAGARYYRGGYAEATRRHAVLSRQVAGMRNLALVATTGPRHGVVKVFLGTTLLKRVDLSSTTLVRSQVFPVAQFATGRSGKVRVVVASADRPVRVEGLGVATQ
jgi:endonuclease/exonuclease/phosphatase family metal-dependent hydrolase